MPSCGSHVGVRQDAQGCFLLSVDGNTYRICPGSQVSCDPNGLGIMIDGELCPFPSGGEDEGNVVTSLSFDPDTLILTLEQSNGPSFDVDLDALASDFYADSVDFDAETRELTITRTGGLPPLVTTIPSDATELPEGTEGQVIGYGEDGQLVAVDLPEPPADEDHYVESAAFDEETRILTLTRTDPLDPLTVEIPSEFQFPETGTPFFLLQRGAAGGVLTEGRLFLGTLSVTSAYPDDAIVPAVSGGAADTAPFGRLRATADPDRITLAKRGDTGTLKAAEAVEPDDLVTLSQLPDPFELPEGDENQVVSYNSDGEPIARSDTDVGYLRYTGSGVGNVASVDASETLPLGQYNFNSGYGSEVRRGHFNIVLGRYAMAGDPDVDPVLGGPSGQVIIGSDATPSGRTRGDSQHGIAIGTQAEVYGGQWGIAIGSNPTSAAQAAIAIGRVAEATALNSVAIGWQSENDVTDTISFGSNTIKRRIRNIAAGIDPTDAVNVSQLEAATGFPEGDENDVLLYGEDGVPEAGKITPAHLDLVPVSPDQDMGFFSVPGGTAPDIFENFKAISAISANWPPNEFSLALRDRDGTLKAAPAEDPDDLVTLAQLNAAAPAGTEFDVLRYGEDGAPEAGRIDIRHMVADGTPLTDGTALAPVFLYNNGELVVSGAYPTTAVPGEAAIAMYATHSVGGVYSFVLQTESIPRNLWFDATTVVGSTRQLAPVSVEMFRDAIRPLYSAIEAIDPIADPTTATVEDVAVKVNEVIATLKALLP